MVVVMTAAPTHAKPDGRTTCCDAFTTFFVDTGEEYCKACYATVTGYVDEPPATPPAEEEQP